VVCGGEGNNPPQKVDGQDVVDVTRAAIKSTVAQITMLPNIPDAIRRVTRTDRVGPTSGTGCSTASPVCSASIRSRSATSR